MTEVPILLKFYTEHIQHQNYIGHVQNLYKSDNIAHQLGLDWECEDSRWLVTRCLRFDPWEALFLCVQVVSCSPTLLASTKKKLKKKKGRIGQDFITWYHPLQRKSWNLELTSWNIQHRWAHKDGSSFKTWIYLIGISGDDNGTSFSSKSNVALWK